ncbi:MAG: hypothetical protein ABI807_02320 [Sporichthyaceae bacterium]
MVVLVPVAFDRSFGWTLNLVVMVLALWFAVLTNFLVETPALRSRLRRLHRVAPPGRPGAVGVGAGCGREPGTRASWQPRTRATSGSTWSG